MAIYYTDVATNQIQGVNFPGYPGSPTLTTQPGSENNALFEGPPEVLATYTWTGLEAANDIINIAIADAGWVVKGTGSVGSGTVAPATTLTVAIGDNDLNLPSALPIPNPQSVVAQPAGFQAPLWVSGTSYVAGNVVIDAASTPANQTFTCILAVSGATAPSSDSSHWIANQKRYSGSINIAGASGNVAFAAGTQLYGGPASIVPYSTTPGSVPQGLTANQIANQQYVIQNDCWLQAVILTCSSPVAGAVSVFRIGVVASN